MITALPRIALAVRDFDAALATFRDTFGMPVFDFSDRTVPLLGAHVAMCAPAIGSNVELMAPNDLGRPLSQALQKFLDKRGEGIYALMLEAPDPDAEAVELAGRGLDVLPLMAGAGGRDVHPRSTHGVLVRVYPNDSADTGGPHAGAAPGLSGIVRAVLATADAPAAATAWGHGFGLAVDATVHDADRGVVSVTCRAPKGGVVELVSAADPSRPFAAAIERSVKEQGGGLYALVLRAADPDAALATLADRGAVTATGPAGREVTVFGTRFVIE